MQTNIVAATTNAVSMVATGSAKTYDITLWVLMPLILVIAAIFISQKMKLKWPTFKWKWSVSWIHGRMLAAVAVWVFLLLTAWHLFPTDWNEFFSKHGWYAYLSLIAATALFLYLFGRKSQTVAGSGGDASTSGGLKTAIWAMFLLSATVVIWGLWSANRTAQAVQTSTVTGRYGVWIQQGFRQTVVTPESWEFITVPKHAVLETVLFEPEDCIWIQRGSEPARMRCGSREYTQTEHPVKKDKYTAIIRPEGNKEVRFLYRLTNI